MLGNEKILVTGATGFDGYNLVKNLINKDLNLILLGRKPNKELEKLIESGKCEFVSCDLTEEDRLKKINFEGVSSLVHLAAVMPESLNPLDDCIPILNNNLIGTVNLVKYLKNLSFIFYFSTIDVYGNPSELPIKETDPTEPLSHYGISKLASEKFLQKFSFDTNIPLTILRSSHIYGPREKERKAIPIFINSALSNKTVYIFGDGSDTRDYVYIEDVVDSILLSLDKKPNEIFNIGSGKRNTINEVANKIISISNSKSQIVYEERRRKKINLVCDISKARTGLSYNPKISLEEGLKYEIEWFKR